MDTRPVSLARICKADSKVSTRRQHECYLGGDAQKAVPRRVRCANTPKLDGEKLRNLLRKAFGHARTRKPEYQKPVVRSYWNGHPDNLVVEMPEGHEIPYEPWMNKHFDIRLDPFMCDPDPDDL